MAIDFMIMPMSRYISGDYVTPMMRAAWEQGIAYAIIGPEGRRECPPGEPFGGLDASARRAALQPMLREDLAALPPPVAAQLWDETSADEPRFHRVDPTSYQALLESAAARAAKPSFFARLSGKQSLQRHTTATLFVPCALGQVFTMSSPFDRVTGSVQAGLNELSSLPWPAEAESACLTLTEALRDALALRLPMIVDW
jgi:hypothetical protein